MSGFSVLTNISIKIKFHTINDEAIIEIIEVFEKYINKSNYLFFICPPYLSDENSILEAAFDSSYTAYDIFDWFEKNLREDTSSLSKKAIITLMNSTIFACAWIDHHVIIRDDLPVYITRNEFHHHIIRKEYGDTKLTCNKHVMQTLYGALKMVDAFKLKAGKSMIVGNGVDIIFLSKKSSRKSTSTGFKIVTKDHIFFVTICITKEDSPDELSLGDDIDIYFECDGKVFKNYNDCIHSAYLVDDMLFNITNKMESQAKLRDLMYDGFY